MPSARRKKSGKKQTIPTTSKSTSAPHKSGHSTSTRDASAEKNLLQDIAEEVVQELPSFMNRTYNHHPIKISEHTQWSAEQTIEYMQSMDGELLIICIFIAKITLIIRNTGIENLQTAAQQQVIWDAIESIIEEIDNDRQKLQANNQQLLLQCCDKICEKFDKETSIIEILKEEISKILREHHTSNIPNDSFFRELAIFAYAIAEIGSDPSSNNNHTFISPPIESLVEILKKIWHSYDQEVLQAEIMKNVLQGNCMREASKDEKAQVKYYITTLLQYSMDRFLGFSAKTILEMTKSLIIRLLQDSQETNPFTWRNFLEVMQKRERKHKEIPPEIIETIMKDKYGLDIEIPRERIEPIMKDKYGLDIEIPRERIETIMEDKYGLDIEIPRERIETIMEDKYGSEITPTSSYIASITIISYEKNHLRNKISEIVDTLMKYDIYTYTDNDLTNVQAQIMQNTQQCIDNFIQSIQGKVQEYLNNNTYPEEFHELCDNFNKLRPTTKKEAKEIFLTAITIDKQAGELHVLSNWHDRKITEDARETLEALTRKGYISNAAANHFIQHNLDQRRPRTL